ncbi:AAA family ATPase [Nocardioides nematodiphilus]|uniref:AAA family ATPase n=1 Tax=Nocardioides nematodiphilus TaxID=2849669 RepID=UPI001CD9CFD7|nr:SMC family ATPase [Nocardioides nematodiphilus]MCA1983716.1 SMC family ATPase [Nocardioides nematodiphilus]
MRLHHLEITAFGPFAGTVSVDLDMLSAAGLFLLSGPTGAGKTSVLDAVCFALYGDVPGDRAAAKRLRCDQAEPGVAPRVVLEATLSGRRFRISRSPAWDRPKKRGNGVTTEQASVTLQEQRGAAWVTHTTRLDEAGYLITDLLGMTLLQFTQVALLPQGRFQAFLRAKSEERKQLLQRLFRTERFTDIERWLREHRIELRRRSETLNQRVADAVSRVSEATETPLPDDWDLGDLSLAAGDGEMVGWVDTIEKRLHDEHLASCATAGDAVAAEAAARAALEEARAFVEARERLDAAAAEHAALEAEAEDVALDSARVEAARRAATVTPVRSLVARARAQHDACLAAVPGDAVLVEATAAHREHVRLVDAARALLPQEQRRDRVAAEATRTAAIHDQLSTELAALVERAEAAPARLDALRADLESARAAAGRAEALVVRARAYVETDRLVTAVAEAKEAYALARTATLELRERALDVRAARLESMAAELAGGLAVGACCPVCGSDEHPHKAAPSADAPDAEAEKAAQKAADDASAIEHLRSLELQDLDTRLAFTREQAGPEAEREAVATELATAQSLAAIAPAAETALSTATRAVEADAKRLTQISAQAAAARTTHEGLAAECADLDRVLAEALEETGADSVAALLAQRERTAQASATLVERLDARDRAAAALAEAERTLADAVTQAGFEDAESAAAAALDPAEIEAATARLKHHERRMAVVSAILAEPQAATVGTQPLPDLPALLATHETAQDLRGRAQAAVAAGATTLARLAELREELDDALAAWGPLRGALATATQLAAFAEGKSADNQLQMSLSAYVVAYRLTQVVEAANERLTTMTDQRYQLEHTASRAAGDRRGGLALLVRDEWSGESRDPATLSGGETFVVSLALALGLADVISQEAGGAMLETLFVDEGFGSLDAETLDDVMAVLDGLRDGGRVVGVVSHVAELRDRIPTQLLVTKSRGGSTLALR